MELNPLEKFESYLDKSGYLFAFPFVVTLGAIALITYYSPQISSFVFGQDLSKENKSPIVQELKIDSNGIERKLF